MDNLPPICKHVSGNVLHAIMQRVRTDINTSGGRIMVGPREKFSSQVHPELLEGMRVIARNEGRHFQAVLEDANHVFR